MLRKVLFVLGGAIYVFAALASESAPVNYLEMYDECVSRHGGANDTTVMSCSGSTGKAAELEMERLYGELSSKYLEDSPVDAKSLEAAQKSWSTYRDLQCELAEKYVGSPMSSVCPMRMVIKRLSEIMELLGE